MRISAILCALALTSCSSCGGTDTQISAPQLAPVDPTEPAPPPTEVARPGPTQVSEGSIVTFATGTNAFAIDLWARTQAGNVAISPVSISLALGMTWAGARGPTAEQMATVLHFSGEDTHRAAAWLLHRYNAPEASQHELRVVNRLFGEQTFGFEEPFLEHNRTHYGAALSPVDFLGAAEPARAEINRWVAEQTNARITNLLPEGSITGTTRLVLTNAVYFVGKWVSAFEPNRTSEQPFHFDGGGQTRVATMQQQSSFRYFESAEVQLLEMPYRGGQFSMVFILPRARDGLGALEAGLDHEAVAAWISAMGREAVNVRLPKFEIDPPEPIALAPTLAQMGMLLAFDENAADFTGIGTPPNSDLRLFISDVFHKAFVKVDEEGTEAAAATAVVMGEGGAAPLDDAPKLFNADHPFLFLIRDVATGAFLFFGRVSDPTGASS